MLTEILIGSAVIVATVIIECTFISIAISTLTRAGGWLSQRGNLIRMILVLGGLTLWLLAGISAALWLWALLFVLLGEFDSVRQAIYFASVSATTLGYGDQLLSDRWNLLSGFIAANGLVLFSLNTAFLFEALRRLSPAEVRNRE
ncbi:MAG: ion channel [Pseudomonadota bacterium]